MLATVMALTACRTATVVAPEHGIGPEQLSPLSPLPVENAARYRVDAEASDIHILVFRGGALARLGHNHVISVRDLEGDIYVGDDFRQSGFTLGFPVDALAVDLPAARREAGEEFATTPSAQAIAGTRENMLGSEVLDAETYPRVRLRSVAISGPDKNPRVRFRITLHGVTREYSLPVQYRQHEQDLEATGTLSLFTSDFGIKPFSILGGGLQVRDGVELHFHIVARRA